MKLKLIILHTIFFFSGILSINANTQYSIDYYREIGEYGKNKAESSSPSMIFGTGSESPSSYLENTTGRWGSSLFPGINGENFGILTEGNPWDIDPNDGGNGQGTVFIADGESILLFGVLTYIIILAINKKRKIKIKETVC